MRELLGKKNHESDSEGGNEDASKTSKNYNKASFDYGGSSKSPTLPMINPRRPPPFDGIRYTDWAHRMKLHLIAARCWEVVDIGVNPPQDPNEWTPKDEKGFPKCNGSNLDLVMSYSRGQQGERYGECKANLGHFEGVI